jgi:hypothetical protein
MYRTEERKREARRRLRVQRRRAGQLRGRVVAISLIAFVALWGIVFVRMATGNDPVLGHGLPAARRGTHSAGPPPRSEPETERETAPAEEEAPIVEEAPVEEEAEALPEEEVAPVEEEAFAPEPEPEPAPVITGQS